MIEGVNILGGYDCSPLPCSPTRDPATNHSMILDQDFEGVLAPSTITRSTTLDGFEITGHAGTPSGTYGAALTVAGGGPTLAHNVVTGGSITGNKTSYGIAIPALGSGPGPLIADNLISGGSGNSTAGITAFGTGSGTVVFRNDIRAGTASGTGSAWGLLLGGIVQVDSNRINTAASSGACISVSGAWCGGISTFSAAADITNNVVLGLPAQRSAAILAGEFEIPAPALRLNSNYLDGGGFAVLTASTSSAAVFLTSGTCSSCSVNAVIGKLRNNVLRGGTNQFRFGVLEVPPVGKTVHPEALRANNFFFPPLSGRIDVLYRYVGGNGETNYTTMSEVNMLLFASGNFLADCLFDATFHLGAGSPCINAGNSIEAPPLDFDGEARPNGGLFDVGPDERYP